MERKRHWSSEQTGRNAEQPLGPLSGIYQEECLSLVVMTSSLRLYALMQALRSLMSSQFMILYYIIVSLTMFNKLMNHNDLKSVYIIKFNVFKLIFVAFVEI
jgi:hypothetical protein